jgi:hypothetical protein
MFRAPVTGFLLSLLLFGGSACRTGVPVIDTGAPPPTADGTIAGHVSGPEGTAPVVGRLVRARSVATGQVYEARTGTAGTYTIMVPPGRYAMELELRTGEQILRQPGEINVNRSDLDTDRDFVIADAALPQD